MEKVGLRSVLARCARVHGLAEPVASVEDGIRRAAGIYGATPTCHLSMAARMRDFEIGDLSDALWSRRSVVRIPAMRGSVYILPRDLVPSGLAIAAASGGARWLLPALRKGGVTDRTIGRLVEGIEDLLHEGPKTASEIRKGLNDWEDPVPQALTLLLRHLAYRGRIVGTRARGGWRSQLYEYALFQDWIELPSKRPSPEEALATLAPLYFEANGPATLANFAWWAGVHLETAKAVATKVRLEPISVEGLEDVHLATRTSLDELAHERDIGSVDLVPFWDSYIMAQKDRRRYLDGKWAKHVVDKGGNATNVLLKDGRVAGIWDFVGDAVRFAPFESVKLDEVRSAAEPLRGVLGFRTVTRVRMPNPLDAAGQNRFMSPLK